MLGPVGKFLRQQGMGFGVEIRLAAKHLVAVFDQLGKGDQALVTTLIVQASPINGQLFPSPVGGVGIKDLAVVARGQALLNEPIG